MALEVVVVYTIANLTWFIEVRLSKIPYLFTTVLILDIISKGDPLMDKNL